MGFSCLRKREELRKRGFDFVVDRRGFGVKIASMDIIILRGTASCGKTTFANLLKSLDDSVEIVCADDFFYKEGRYVFDASQLSTAHKTCREKFKELVDRRAKTIIVANTNTKEWEFADYKNYGRENGYQITFLVLENRHGNTNSHNVPPETIKRQKENLILSLKLT